MRREIDELAHAKNRMLERAEVSVVVSHTGLWVPGCTNARGLGNVSSSEHIESDGGGLQAAQRRDFRATDTDSQDAVSLWWS